MARLPAAYVESVAEDSEVVRRALAAGAVNDVLKPFPPAVLTERLVAFARFWWLLGAGAHLDQTAVCSTSPATDTSG